MVKSPPPSTSLCVVIPAYNEELVIATSLQALRKVISLRHVYVVSDGSTDATASIAKQYLKNVLDLKENVGKAQALHQLIDTYQLSKRYQYILFSDADSRLSANFKKALQPYMSAQPACIVGTVTSDRHGLVSAYRSFEYSLSHRVYKRAQSIMGVITVAPGCASLYRTDVMDQLDFSRRSLTEDFDLTLQIYRKHLGRIVYAPLARVITQDPLSLTDYWKQVTRWYTGLWQNIGIHKVYLPRSWVDLELLLLIGDGLSWIILLLLSLWQPGIILTLLGFSALAMAGLATFLLCLEQQYWAIRYVLFFPLFQLINTLSFIYSFFRSLTSSGKPLSWQKVKRYNS